jgi:hypothetical protein
MILPLRLGDDLRSFVLGRRIAQDVTLLRPAWECDDALMHPLAGLTWALALTPNDKPSSLHLAGGPSGRPEAVLLAVTSAGGGSLCIPTVHHGSSPCIPQNAVDSLVDDRARGVTQRWL